MQSIQPHVHSVGQGPAVVLLHSSGSSGRQWAPLMEDLAPRFRLHAVDLHGHGRSPVWPGQRPLSLDDDAAAVESLICTERAGVHLVGHSYGGAVALKIAQRHPRRVRSVAAFEPVLFRLLFDYNARDAAATEIVATARSIVAWLGLGFPAQAAQRFIDYWSRPGAWASMPDARRQGVAARMPSIARHFGALFSESLSRRELARIDVPTLVMTGARTKASTRRIGELLRLAMPTARHERLPGMGHMGPVTHPAQVNARIAAFLDAQVARNDAWMPLPAAA
jgi:pimeloyl-ACP methyl ester carboxylesterase